MSCACNQCGLHRLFLRENHTAPSLNPAAFMLLHIHNSWMKRSMSQYMILGIIIIYGEGYADCCDGASGGVGDKLVGL